MLYVQQSLAQDEEIVHVGHFHWFYTFQAMMSIVWGIVIAIFIVFASIYGYKELGYYRQDIGTIVAIQNLHPGLRVFAFLMLLMGLLRFAQMMVIKATTEIAVTNSRMIYKKGVIARHVGEISIDRIEGVNVLQSILGRIFNFGRIAIRGMGVGEVVLPPIEDPLAFRRAIEKARAI